MAGHRKRRNPYEFVTFGDLAIGDKFKFGDSVYEKISREMARTPYNGSFAPVRIEMMPRYHVQRVATPVQKLPVFYRYDEGDDEFYGYASSAEGAKKVARHSADPSAIAEVGVTISGRGRKRKAWIVTSEGPVSWPERVPSMEQNPRKRSKRRNPSSGAKQRARGTRGLRNIFNYRTHPLAPRDEYEETRILAERARKAGNKEYHARYLKDLSAFREWDKRQGIRQLPNPAQTHNFVCYKTVYGRPVVVERRADIRSAADAKREAEVLRGIYGYKKVEWKGPSSKHNPVVRRPAGSPERYISADYLAEPLNTTPSGTSYKVYRRDHGSNKYTYATTIRLKGKPTDTKIETAMYY